MTVGMQSVPVPRNVKPDVGNIRLHPKQTA